ncbi:MAG TPA: hypothetical protein QF359_05970, partial [Rhodospirillales bacterium]|nr:hypothetical protein [Rhodospirillales bacterium]
ISDLPASLAAHKNVTLLPFEKAVQNAVTVLLLTDHREFKSTDLTTALDGKKIIDTRGVWPIRS